MDENKDDLLPQKVPDQELSTEGAYKGRRLQQEGKWRRLWQDYGFVPTTVIVMLVLFKVILQIAWVPSGSMEDTLPTRSLLLSWQMPYVFADPTPQRGDVVTFRSEELGKLLVKRVIGLPGDTVSIKNGYVYINGEVLEEDYLPQQGITYQTGSTSVFEVPADCVLVMGDNRTGSYDSRAWGNPYINVEKIKSKALVDIAFLPQCTWKGVHYLY